jgi:peroxiredoxin
MKPILRPLRKYFAILMSLLVLLSACGGASSETRSGVVEGRRAVDFSLDGLDGRPVSLADFAGKVVLINFWASWCGPCELEMPDIQKQYEAHKDEGLAVIAVNSGESPADVKKFVDKYGLTFPVVIDARGQVGAQYRAAGLPMSLFVDRDGVIQVRHLGYMSDGQLKRYLAQLGID